MADLKPTTESPIPAKPLSVIPAFLLSSPRRRGSIFLCFFEFFMLNTLYFFLYYLCSSVKLVPAEAGICG